VLVALTGPSIVDTVVITEGLVAVVGLTILVVVDVGWTVAVLVGVDVDGGI